MLLIRMSIAEEDPPATSSAILHGSDEHAPGHQMLSRDAIGLQLLLPMEVEIQWRQFKGLNGS